MSEEEGIEAGQEAAVRNGAAGGADGPLAGTSGRPGSGAKAIHHPRRQSVPALTRDAPEWREGGQRREQMDMLAALLAVGMLAFGVVASVRAEIRQRRDRIW